MNKEKAELNDKQVPFFARFLEGQDGPDANGAGEARAMHPPTRKYPSDTDEFSI